MSRMPLPPPPPPPPPCRQDGWVWLLLPQFKDEMPKLPMSAYMLFSHSVKKKFMEKHPGLTQRELAGKIGGCGWVRDSGVGVAG